MNIAPTPQQAYEGMKKYFSRPGAQLAYDDDAGQCMYRTTDNRRCAVGCLIPDALYDESFENPSCNDAPSVLQAIGWGADKALRDFCYEAQTAHDGSSDVGAFLDSLDDLARMFELDIAA